MSYLKLLSMVLILCLATFFVGGCIPGLQLPEGASVITISPENNVSVDSSNTNTSTSTK